MKEKAASSNFNQAIWLAISSFSSFALAIFSAAILSRYFYKAEYGTYKQILYVYTTLQTIFAAGLPSVFTYFIPRLTQGQGKKLINSVNHLFILLGFFFSFFLYISSDLIAVLLKNSELSTGLKIFSPFPLFTIPALGVEGIYTALKNTKSIAFYQAGTKILMLVCIVFPVIVLNGSYRSAIIGWGIASFLTFIIAMVMKNRPYVKIKAELIPGMYKTIFNYSLPLMGASLVGMVLQSADQFFISRYYGQVTFADFSNGYIQIPFIGMIAGSVSSVLLPLFSKAESEGKLYMTFETYERATLKTISLIYPLIFFCIFFAKDLVILMYGEQYEVSKSYLRVSLLRGIIQVFHYLPILLALGKSNVYFLVHFIFALSIWLVDFIIVMLLLPPISIAISSALVQVLMSLVMFGYLNIKHKISLIPINILKYMLVTVSHLTIGATIVLLIRNIFMKSVGTFVVLSVTLPLFYLLIVSTGKLLRIDYATELIVRIKEFTKLEK